MRFSVKDLQGRLWKEQKVIMDYSTPLAHNEHGRVESKIKILKEYLEKIGHTKRKHSFVEWESICLSISSMINGLPICHNQDERNAGDELGLITPNMFIMGRNNNRSPEGFASMEFDPNRALERMSDINSQLLDILADYVHRFIPGRRLAEGQTPEEGDIVLFVMKEAEKSRNVRHKYGRILSTNVDGRPNKVRIIYKNHSETIMREVERNIKDVVLIRGSNEIDFNTVEHYLAARIQRKYLFVVRSNPCQQQN